MSQCIPILGSAESVGRVENSHRNELSKCLAVALASCLSLFLCFLRFLKHRPLLEMT